MGHQSNDARKALRAYASELQSSASRGGFAPSADTSKQDDAPNQFLGAGAPHQLAMAAVVVCVVLLGGIGLVAATNTADVPGTGPTQQARALEETSSGALITTERITTPNAIRTLHELGLTRAADALDEAVDAGLDSSPAVRQAIERLFDIIGTSPDSAEQFSQDGVVLALAISDLESAIRPPGLDIDRVQPGNGGIPPGLDDAWLEQVKERGILSPTEDPVLVPPGRDKVSSGGNGRDEAPGQTKNNEKKDNGKP